MNRIKSWAVVSLICAVLGFSATTGRAADTSKKPTSEAKKNTSRGDKLDLNTASLADLKAIRGLNEGQAKKIIEGRPYKKRNELLSKKIVDAETYENIKARLYTKRAAS